MTRYLFYSVLLLFISCSGNNAGDSNTETGDLPDTAATLKGPPALPFIVSEADPDTIIANPAYHNEPVTVEGVIAALNAEYPAVRLEKQRQAGDTLFTTIRDALVLTDQMGTTGAGNYLAKAVVNLTSVAGIRYVSMDFEEGSHAGPGIYIREDFKRYFE